VRIDSMILADGFLCNNLPVDVAREMGADYVITVSLSEDKVYTVNDFRTATSAMTRIMDVVSLNKIEENWANSDVKIHVNVKGYSAASFNKEAVDTLIRRGYEAASKEKENLLRLKEKILGKNSDSYVREKIKRPKTYNKNNLHIKEIQLNEINESDQKYILRKYRSLLNKTVSTDDIEKMLVTIENELQYNQAAYQIIEDNDGKDVLKVNGGGKKAMNINIGMRYDNEEKAVLGLNTIFPLKYLPLTVEATGRLGVNYMGKITGVLHSRTIAGIELSYMYHHYYLDIYHKAKEEYSVNFDHHQIDLSFTNFTFRNLFFDLFARMDFTHYRSTLSASDVEKKDNSAEHLFSYHARVHYSSQTDDYFPERGSKFKAEYGLYTTNSYQWEGNKPLSILSASWKTAIPMGKGFVLQPYAYGRIISGGDPSTLIANYAGGHYEGHFLQQQMPFAGIGEIEYFDRCFVAFDLTMQKRVYKKHYAFLSAAVAEQGYRPQNIFSGTPIVGGRIGYAYNSLLGPIGGSIAYSNYTNKVDVFVNLGFFF